MGLEVEVVGESNKFDVIVIDGGVAGMTASVFVTLNKLKSCFLEKEVPGGKLMQIETVHNFAQAPNIKGSDLAVNIFNGAVEQVKTTYSSGNVVAMKSRNDYFYLYTEDGTTWQAKAIIIATGTVISKLNLPNAERLENHGLSYCVLCDGALAKDKKVVIIGEALNLPYINKYTNDVTIIKEQDVKDIVGTDKVQGVMNTDGTLVPCDMIFVQTGYKSNNKFLIPEIRTNNNGEVIVNEKLETNFPGVYACGDCTNSQQKLIANAMYQAEVAARGAVEYINSKKW